ncbi:MAG: hypothetical protein U9N43_06760 [Euryarchaeota archaeon]|nr:hypothetical protein [Euryarchaeota archaeon]
MAIKKILEAIFDTVDHKRLVEYLKQRIMNPSMVLFSMLYPG